MENGNHVDPHNLPSSTDCIIFLLCYRRDSRDEVLRLQVQKYDWSM
jgi:hypothetical protein